MIGLGNIGSGVCANLIADGHRVTVLDTDPARLKTQVDAGAAAAANPAEVAAATDITFLSLPTPEVMDSVSEQWLEGAGRGKVLVDLTTNSPSSCARSGGVSPANGAHLVEAPLTGGAPGARNRMLVFIVGGEPEVVARVTPLLDALGRGVFHLGPLGCGNVGKLVNSLMAFTTMWVSLEGLALAAKNGIDLRRLLDMIRTSGGANSYLERRVEEISERGRPPDFAIELAAKDAGLMLEVGRQASVPLPVASAVHQMLVLRQGAGFRRARHQRPRRGDGARPAGLRLELGHPTNPEKGVTVGVHRSGATPRSIVAEDGRCRPECRDAGGTPAYTPACMRTSTSSSLLMPTLSAPRRWPASSSCRPIAASMATVMSERSRTARLGRAQNIPKQNWRTRAK